MGLEFDLWQECLTQKLKHLHQNGYYCHYCSHFWLQSHSWRFSSTFVSPFCPHARSSLRKSWLLHLVAQRRLSQLSIGFYRARDLRPRKRLGFDFDQLFSVPGLLSASYFSSACERHRCEAHCIRALELNYLLHVSVDLSFPVSHRMAELMLRLSFTGDSYWRLLVA